MADVVETRDLTRPGEDGWVVVHDVRRSDGELVFVRVRCRDIEAIRAEQNLELVAALHDRGAAAACTFAERMRPTPEARDMSLDLCPASAGGVLVSRAPVETR
jgi:hypothetical protein